LHPEIVRMLMVCDWSAVQRFTNLAGGTISGARGGVYFGGSYKTVGVATAPVL